MRISDWSSDVCSSDLQAQKAQARVINHGDMHLGNLYVDADGTPGFLDAQPRLGAWSIDVSYLLIAGLDLVDRRHCDGALRAHSLSCLRAEGVDPPSFGTAWPAHTRDFVRGLPIVLLHRRPAERIVREEAFRNDQSRSVPE